MIGKKLYGACMDYRDEYSEFLLVGKQTTWPNQSGFFLLIADDLRAYVTESQLRTLREQITKALDESPQDDSKIEHMSNCLKEIQMHVSMVDNLIHNRPITAESESK